MASLRQRLTRQAQRRRDPGTISAQVGLHARRSVVDLPRTLDQRLAIVLLEMHGWYHERGGKHAVKMTKPGKRPITLPQHRGATYSAALTRAILRQVGLT